MWQLIAAIFGAVIGFSAGTAGLNQIFPEESTGTQPLEVYNIKSCYSPEPGVKLTLKWPDNFQNVNDYRAELNPAIFPSSSFPATFSSEAACENMILRDTNDNPQQERTYIRVRRNARMSSCKTDEYAGPYNLNNHTCNEVGRGPTDHRGKCVLDGYTDLRKIADSNDGGNIKEIFWVPYSYHVGCNYEYSNNCGPGDHTNLNLREFIYVLDKRDAFPPEYGPSNPSTCAVKWDAGSTDKGACSHFFDIYMAEDLYNKVQSDVPQSDPDYATYQFYKQAIENCQDQSGFIPVVDTAGLAFPPTFIEKPFVTHVTPPPPQEAGKITPLNEDYMIANYTHFVLANPAFNPTTTSLYLITKSDTVITACQPPPMAPAAAVSHTPTPSPTMGPSCYAPLGSIPLKKDQNDTVIFNVYSRYDSPQTFFFQDQSGTDPKVYHYTITDMIPNNDRYQHKPALQLTNLEFISENEWTWATPWCKPAIYLYPEKETEMNVRLNVDGKITLSDPLYDEGYGWNVKAYPDGRIIPNSKSVYPYLYYEADVNGVTLPKAGFVVAREKLKYQITKMMKEIGFNQKETSDFLSYWLPRLTEKPYYFVSLMSEEMINRKETLTFSQTPDTLIRARFVFEGLNLPTFVTPLSIPRHTRSGFTVTDWGGTLVGASCSEVEVK